MQRVLHQSLAVFAWSLGLTGSLLGLLQCLRPWVGNTVYAGCLATLPFLVAWLFPVVLRMAWTLSPLPPGPLRHRLLHLTQARRLPLTEILVWHTQQQVTNAMVVGLTNRTRRLILSDGLLARCTASEIEALTEHEFAHVAGQHAWIRLIWWSLPVLYLTVFDQPPVDPVEVHGSAAIAPLLCLSFLACLWFVGFSGLCHRLEFHADRIAVRRLCQRQDPDRALKGYQSTLRKLTAASPRSTWTHPSYWERSWRLRDHSDRHTS